MRYILLASSDPGSEYREEVKVPGHQDFNPVYRNAYLIWWHCSHFLNFRCQAALESTLKKKPPQDAPVTFETVREIALALPAVEEGLSYGTSGFRVKGKLFARIWEDGETLVLKIGFDAREILMKASPAAFFITDHYAGYPSVLVRLPAIDRRELASVVEEAWRFNAPKRILADHDASEA